MRGNKKIFLNDRGDEQSSYLLALEDFFLSPVLNYSWDLDFAPGSVEINKAEQSLLTTWRACAIRFFLLFHPFGERSNEGCAAGKSSKYQCARCFGYFGVVTDFCFETWRALGFGSPESALIAFQPKNAVGTFAAPNLYWPATSKHLAHSVFS